MTRITHWSTALALLVASQGSQAITIDFDYSLDSSNFFSSNPNAVTALEAAGTYLSTRLSDSLNAITTSGSNVFNLSFLNPSTGASTIINNANIAANTLVVYVGGASLGGSTLGQGGPGGWSASGTTTFFSAIRTRGGGDTSNSDGNGVPAVDFAPWGGTIKFNNTSSWYYDADPSTLESFPGQSDFYSVALHELGHVLGYGTSDSWSNQISGGTSFIGAHAEAANGGSPVPLANSAHWQEGLMSTVAGVPQEAAMDPSILVGSRKLFTDVDWAGLADIGWQVTATPVPVPPAAVLFASSLMGLLRWRRKAG